MFYTRYVLYIMMLHSSTNEISLLTITIQRQLLKNFRLQHQEMNVYKIRFAEHRWDMIALSYNLFSTYFSNYIMYSFNSTCWNITCIITIISSPSSSSPGKLSLLSKQRLIVSKNVYYHNDISSWKVHIAYLNISMLYFSSSFSYFITCTSTCRKTNPIYIWTYNKTSIR